MYQYPGVHSAYPPSQNFQMKQSVPTYPLNSFFNASPQNSIVFYSSKPLQNINCILEPSQKTGGGVYLGDILCLLKKQLLIQNKIEAVLTCMTRQQCSKSNVNFDHPNLPPSIKMTKSISASDSLQYPLNHHFEESYAFIQKARNSGKNVLVHCHAGVSRSATLVCAYLMKKERMNFQQAFKYLKNKRSRVRPNRNFVELLKNYENYQEQSTKTKNFEQNENEKSGEQNNRSFMKQQVKKSIEQLEQKQQSAKQRKKYQAFQNNEQKIEYKSSNSFQNKSNGESSFIYPLQYSNNTQMTKSIGINQASRKSHQFQGSFTHFSHEKSLQSSSALKYSNKIFQSIGSPHQYPDPKSQNRKPWLYDESSYKPLTKVESQEANQNQKKISESFSQNGGISYLTTSSPPKKSSKYIYGDGEEKPRKHDENKKRKKLFKQKKKDLEGNCLFDGIRRLCM